MDLGLFDKPPFTTDYGTAPGASLREQLDKLGLSQSDLAERTGRPKKTINEIIQGKAAITPETALQFERVLHIPASFWLNLERLYRAAQARHVERGQLIEHLSWLDRLPVKEIVKRGWIKGHADRVELLREVLAFFAIAFPTAWDEVWRETRKATALRQGKSADVDFGVVAVWLRRGEIEGRKRECRPYDSTLFRQALDHARTLTTLPAEKFCQAIQEHCAEAGVAVVLVREFPRLRIFGAARWLSPDKALIQLSLHYKREDQLLFSFFHEAGHVLLHGRRDIFVDFANPSADKQEVEANRFAEDYLIPRATYERFTAVGNYSESAVVHFARQVGVAPGIVVGRLQHDEKIGFNHLAPLRRKVAWSGESVVRVA
jgi:HTH-type transcriptional regulator/antitoxin HigA